MEPEGEEDQYIYECHGEVKGLNELILQNHPLPAALAKTLHPEVHVEIYITNSNDYQALIDSLPPVKYISFTIEEELDEININLSHLAESLTFVDVLDLNNICEITNVHFSSDKPLSLVNSVRFEAQTKNGPGELFALTPNATKLLVNCKLDSLPEALMNATTLTFSQADDSKKILPFQIHVDTDYITDPILHHNKIFPNLTSLCFNLAIGVVLGFGEEKFEFLRQQPRLRELKLARYIKGVIRRVPQLEHIEFEDEPDDFEWSKMPSHIPADSQLRVIGPIVVSKPVKPSWNRDQKLVHSKLTEVAASRMLAVAKACGGDISRALPGAAKQSYAGPICKDVADIVFGYM